jgi:diguanylate cyclase (GGDEF)-like protein/PAS domain S-box-containing protein
MQVESQPNLDLGEFQVLMSNAGIGIVVHDLDGRVVEANYAYARLLGYTLDEALQLSVDDVIHPDARAKRDEDLRTLLGGAHERISAERKFVRRDGTTIWVRSRKSILTRDAETYVLVCVEDWTEHRERLSELEHAADHDWLTRVKNRSGLHADIAGRMETTRAIALLMIDLNEFKSVNDNYGHRVGDEVLKQVARRLVEVVDPQDTVARRSGDEFVIVTSPERVERISDLVHRALLSPIGVEVDHAPPLHMSAAVGSASLINGMTLTDLLDAADRSMYRHKRSKA